MSSINNVELAPTSVNIKYTKNMSQTALNGQIEKYYEMKMKYNKEKKKIISKISAQGMSAKEKRRQYARTQAKCVNCKRKVGTIFSETGNTLLAKCGASTGKFRSKTGEVIRECNLNMAISLPEYYDIEDIITEYGTILSKLKKDLKILKLKHIYGHIDDAESLAAYNELITDYQSYSEVYASLKAKKIEQNNDENEEMYTLEHEHSQIINSIVDGFKEAAENPDHSRELKKKIFGFYKTHFEVVSSLREKKEFKTQYEEDEDGIGGRTFKLKNLMVENEIIIQ